jgi:hypothetical protein
MRYRLQRVLVPCRMPDRLWPRSQTEQERFIVLSVDGDWGPHRVAPIATVWRVDTQVYVRVTGPEVLALPVCDPVAYGPGHGLRRRMRTTAG